MLKITTLKVTLVISALLILILPQWLLPRTEQLRFYFLDVGQGDAILIITPDEHTLLIDTGPDIKASSELAKYAPGNVLDLLILTHPDLDHIGGLLDVLQRFSFNRVIAGSDEYLKAYNYKAEDIPYLPVVLGCCVRLDFIQHGADGTTNGTSIAVKLTFQGFSAFFDGDLPSGLEDQIAKDVGKVDLLKLAHHGSKSSSSEFFLAELHPEVAVISVGLNNKYGHPNAEVLERLKQLDITFLETRFLGTIILETDGKSLVNLPVPKFLW
jgi:competence protein ComEC